MLREIERREGWNLFRTIDTHSIEQCGGVNRPLTVAVKWCVSMLNRWLEKRLTIKATLIIKDPLFG